MYKRHCMRHCGCDLGAETSLRPDVGDWQTSLHRPIEVASKSGLRKMLLLQDARLYLSL